MPYGVVTVIYFCSLYKWDNPGDNISRKHSKKKKKKKNEDNKIFKAKFVVK